MSIISRNGKIETKAENAFYVKIWLSWIGFTKTKMLGKIFKKYLQNSSPVFQKSIHVFIGTTAFSLGQKGMMSFHLIRLLF